MFITRHFDKPGSIGRKPRRKSCYVRVLLPQRYVTRYRGRLLSLEGQLFLSLEGQLFLRRETLDASFAMVNFGNDMSSRISINDFFPSGALSVRK